MSYTKTTWATGDVVTAAKMNNLESGVYNNDAKIGTLGDLDTTDKSDLVAAINEVGANADANASDITDLNTDLTLEQKYQLLLNDEVPNTTETYTFGSDGSVSQVTHTFNGTAVRTDAFTYTTSTITEVRTLNSGESLTIATNLSTLETTVTYTAA